MSVFVEVVEKLIDRCIQLFRERKGQDQQYYEKVVAPLYDQFERVHECYLHSFRKYRELLSNTETALTPSHPLFAEILQDGLFSENLRSKLRAMLAIEPCDSQAAPILQAIRAYLSLASRALTFSYGVDVPLLPDANSNDPPVSREVLEKLQELSFALAKLDIGPLLGSNIRSGTLQMAKLVSNLHICDSDKKQLTIKTIDRTVGMLQARYADVSSANIALLKRLAS